MNYQECKGISRWGRGGGESWRSWKCGAITATHLYLSSGHHCIACFSPAPSPHFRVFFPLHTGLMISLLAFFQVLHEQAGESTSGYCGTRQLRRGRRRGRRHQGCLLPDQTRWRSPAPPHPAEDCPPWLLPLLHLLHLHHHLPFSLLQHRVS